MKPPAPTTTTTTTTITIPSSLLIDRDSPAYAFWTALLSILKPHTDLHVVNRSRLSPTAHLPFDKRSVIIEQLQKAKSTPVGKANMNDGSDHHICEKNDARPHKNDLIVDLLLDFGILYLRTNEFKTSKNESFEALDQFTHLLHQLANMGLSRSKFAALIYNNRALVYADYKNHGKAIEDYNEAILIEPSYAMCYFNRAVTSAALLDPDATLTTTTPTTTTSSLPHHASLKPTPDSIMRDYSEAIRLDPTYPFPYNNRGVMYYEARQMPNAIKDCQMALNVDSNYCNAHFNLSLCCSYLERYIHAYKHVTEASRISPKDNYLRQQYFLRLKVRTSSKDVLFRNSSWWWDNTITCRKSVLAIKFVKLKKKLHPRSFVVV